MANKAIFCLGFLFCSNVSAGSENPFRRGSANDVGLTGNIRVDLFSTVQLSPDPFSYASTDEQQVGTTKSPWVAAGLSLLVPGAGEFYAESYWKAAAFFALDIAAWSIAYAYDNRGDDQTASFQSFANGHWSVARYAQWTIDNARSINIDVTAADFFPDGTWNGNWSALNDLERAIGGWYSHTLYPFGEQQYYEVIGKYAQYYQGWDDADPSLRDFPAISAKLDTGMTRFTYYSGERGKANDFYNTASTAVTVAIVTHIVSAIDAAWSASSFNDGLHAKVSMMKVPRGESYSRVPVLNISYRF